MFVPFLAYIGPGAGFAFLGSFLSLVISVLLTAGFFSGMAFSHGMGNQASAETLTSPIIFLGLDGLDPGLTERFMAEGKLPNLSRLKEQGCFHRLRTTFPPQRGQFS